jgi:cytochrome c-type biogenesis protein CcmH
MPGWLCRLERFRLGRNCGVELRKAAQPKLRAPFVSWAELCEAQHSAITARSHSGDAKSIGKTIAVALCAALLCAGAARAVEPDEILPDARMEARARALSAELRCLVCQNQSIDDSNAPLARDLRIIVRERLKAGDSEDAVRAFLVARYGTFVLLRPPVGRSTVLLWATPALLLGFAGWLLWRKRRESDALAAAPEPLSKEEAARLDRLTGS